MILSDTKSKPAYGSQKLSDKRIHRWSQTILGYPDHLVSGLLSEFGMSSSSLVMDPFSGSGTTAVECMKRNISCIGVDANPASCLIARAKTSWGIDTKILLECADFVLAEAPRHLAKQSFESDITARYLIDSGMVARGWIASEKLRDVIALKQVITRSTISVELRDLMMVALATVLVRDASNVKFGPELYCCSRKKAVDVFAAYKAVIHTIAYDLAAFAPGKSASAKIVYGNSRELSDLFGGQKEIFDAVITSPPYPAEHDYTRNLRLELVLFEQVVSRESLRAIKKQMLRSHSKGLYAEDSDSDILHNSSAILKLRDRVKAAVEGRADGFSKAYPRVCMEYFGGMRRHFRSLFPLLKRGARCAYVVGDQASYMRVQIPTAELLAGLAQQEGFSVREIRLWRERHATATRSKQNENILILQRPYLRK